MCSNCKIGTHYYCQGVNENTFSKMSKNTKNKWTCNECKNKWNKKVDIYDSSKEKITLENLATSVQYMSDKFDTFNATVNKILDEMKQIREQNQILYEKNEKLSTEVQFLHLKIDDLEQKTLDKAVEIIGIPTSPSEDCKTIVEEIANKLNIKCNVKKAYRISTKNKDMKIIAWLTTKEAKKELLETSKKNKITTNQVHENWPSTRCYINEYLTKYRRVLFGKSKIKAKDKGFKYVWINNSDILVRKDEQSRVHRIRNENDWDNLK